MASTHHNYHHQYHDDDHQYEHYQMESQKVQQLRSELAELRECTENALASSTAEMDRLRAEKLQKSSLIERLEKEVKDCYDGQRVAQQNIIDEEDTEPRTAGPFKRRNSFGATRPRRGRGGVKRRGSLGSLGQLSASSLGGLLGKAGGKKNRKNNRTNGASDDDTKSFSSMFGGFSINGVDSASSSSSEDLSSSSSDLSLDEESDDVLMRNAAMLMATSGTAAASDDNDNRSVSSVGDFLSRAFGGKKVATGARNRNTNSKHRGSSGAKSAGAIEDLLMNAAVGELSSDTEDYGLDLDIRSQGHLSCSALGVRKKKRRKSLKRNTGPPQHIAFDAEESQSNMTTQSPPPFLTRAQAEALIKEMQLRLRNRSLLHSELERSCAARQRKITSIRDKLQNHEASGRTKAEVRRYDHARLKRYRDASVVSLKSLVSRISAISLEFDKVDDEVGKKECRLKDLSSMEKERDDRCDNLVSELKKQTKKVNKSRIKTQLDLRIKERNSDGVLKCIKENLRDAQDADASVNGDSKCNNDNDTSEMKEEVVMEVILQTQTLKKMAIGISNEIRRRKMELEDWRKSQREMTVIDPAAEKVDEKLKRANRTLEDSELNASLISNILQLSESISNMCTNEVDAARNLQERSNSNQNEGEQKRHDGATENKMTSLPLALHAFSSLHGDKFEQWNQDQDLHFKNDSSSNYDSARSRLKRNILSCEEEAETLSQRLEQAKKDTSQFLSDLAHATEVGERTSKIHLSTMKTMRKKVIMLIDQMGSEEQRVHDLTQSIESSEARINLLRNQIARYDSSSILLYPPSPQSEINVCSAEGNSIDVKSQQIHSIGSSKDGITTSATFAPRKMETGLHSPPPLDMSMVGL